MTRALWLFLLVTIIAVSASVLADIEGTVTINLPGREIRLAIREIETRLKQSAIAAETHASWQQRLGDLKSLREVGSATPQEIQQAQLEVTAAESTLLKQVIAARLAQVKLKEAQGLLAAESGYDIGTCLAGLCCP